MGMRIGAKQSLVMAAVCGLAMGCNRGGDRQEGTAVLPTGNGTEMQQGEPGQTTTGQTGAGVVADTPGASEGIRPRNGEMGGGAASNGMENGQAEMQQQNGANGQPMAGAETMGAGAGAALLVPTDTRELLVKLHHINEMEIQAGQLAEKQGQSNRVREFGRTLVRDHRRANQQLMTFAKKRKIELPKGQASAMVPGAGAQDAPATGTQTGGANQIGEARGVGTPTGAQPERTGTATGGTAAADMAPMAQDPAMSQMMQAMERLRNTQGEAFDQQFAQAMERGHEQVIQMVTTAQQQVQDKQLSGLLRQSLPPLRTHLQTAQSLAGQPQRAGSPQDQRTTR